MRYNRTPHYQITHALLSDTTSPKSYHVDALCLLSRLCAVNGVHPAQGLRLARRHYPRLWADLKKQPTLELAENLFNKIQSETLRTIKTLDIQYAPEHFLLDTNLKCTFEQHESYTAPYKNPHPEIHFIRTQRRYNKRRYARVRAVSRPSFWAGMMLSTLVTGAFWGATLQGLDWGSTQAIIVDVNAFITLCYVILGIRFIRLFKRAARFRYREANKARRGIRFNLVKKNKRPWTW